MQCLINITLIKLRQRLRWEIGNIKTALGKSYNGVIVAFAPYDSHRLPLLGLLSLGESSGSTAGYIAKAALMKYFGWKSTNGN